MHAVDEIGTTHSAVDGQFRAALENVKAGQGADPIGFSARFGSGKTHLLEYLQGVAIRAGFVTSRVVVSPEMPPGNPVAVLKEVAQSATAPGLTGDALRELGASAHADSSAFAAMQSWALDAKIDDRFRAILHIYDELWADEELRVRILEDVSGKPMTKSEIGRKLKEMNQSAGYVLKGGPKNSLLAHDRLQVFARLCVAFGASGFVVLVDELERLATFTFQQRLAAYGEIAWWCDAASRPGSFILPVFTMVEATVRETLRKDRMRLSPGHNSSFSDDRDNQIRRGLDLIEKISDTVLRDPTPEQIEDLKYRLYQLYRRAYPAFEGQMPPTGTAVSSLRAHVRQWITYWDLARFYPDAVSHLVTGDVEHDMTEVPDSDLIGDDGRSAEE
jgi:hypothetical protein